MLLYARKRKTRFSKGIRDLKQNSGFACSEMAEKMKAAIAIAVSRVKTPEYTVNLIWRILFLKRKMEESAKTAAAATATVTIYHARPLKPKGVKPVRPVMPRPAWSPELLINIK